MKKELREESVLNFRSKVIINHADCENSVHLIDNGNLIDIQNEAVLRKCKSEAKNETILDKIYILSELDKLSKIDAVEEQYFMTEKDHGILFMPLLHNDHFALTIVDNNAKRILFCNSMQSIPSFMQRLFGYLKTITKFNQEKISIITTSLQNDTWSCGYRVCIVIFFTMYI